MEIIVLTDLERYRSYLCFLARVQLGDGLRRRVDPSDIAQQSLLQAHQARNDFRGSSEAEMIAWLRKILSRTIAHVARDLHADKRDIDRERSIHAAVDASSLRLEQLLAADQATPSRLAERREHAVLVAEAVESLTAEQREAIVLRYWRGMKLKELAAAMNKSPSAAAGLLHRGLKTLRTRLKPLGPK